MSASVTIRLPNRAPLLVKDPKFRASRVLAQNSVAQLALDKLSVDDPDLKAKMDALAEEIETNRINSELAPPPPPPHRFASSPGYPGGWRAPRYNNHHYYDASPAQFYPAPYGMPMYPPYVARSNSAPTEEMYPEMYIDPYAEPYYYPAPALEPGVSNVSDGAPLMTPTGGNWPYPGYPYQAAAWPYYPYETAPAYYAPAPESAEPEQSGTKPAETSCH